MMNRFLSADYIFTGDSPIPITNACVEVSEEGEIIALRRIDDLPQGVDIEKFAGAITPGFVNAHCHVELSGMQGKFRKGTGMAGFIDQINELRNTLTVDEKKKCIKHWMDKMWERGVSAMADISNGPDSFAIKAETPMYTRTFLEVFGTEPEDCDAVMEGVRALEKQAKSIGIDAAPTPHSCYTMSPLLLTASSRAGLESGYLSFHSEESVEEEEMLISGSGPMYENRVRAGMSLPPVTGESSLKYFIDRLLEVHPAPFTENILLVHEVCMTEEGVDAVNKVMLHPFVALCPCSNIFIHNALPPVMMMREKGVKLTVGTDSLSSNDDLDMVRELFCLQENFTDIPLGEMIMWATFNGAEFLGKGDVYGKIAPGMKPGLVHISGLDSKGLLTVASVSKRII